MAVLRLVLDLAIIHTLLPKQVKKAGIESSSELSLYQKDCFWVVDAIDADGKTKSLVGFLEKARH